MKKVHDWFKSYGGQDLEVDKAVQSGQDLYCDKAVITLTLTGEEKGDSVSQSINK